jgi:hypothetical protein
MAHCQFSGAQKELCYGLEHFRWGLTKMVSRLRSTASDSELVHSQLEGRPFHSKMCRCSVGTCHNPIGLLKSSKNLLTFRFLQNVVKCAICRFRRSGFFCRGAGFGNFKVANIDTQGRPPRDNNGTLDHILELSYIPRPMVSA